MAVRLKKVSSGSRLQLGLSILAAARTVDTRLVKDRLRKFEQAHRNYVSAQKKVDAAESQLTAVQARLAELDAVQDDAVDALARVLIHDGQPIGNAFSAFGAPGPGTLKRLPFGEEVAAIHELVAAVLRSKGVSEAATKAAQAADKAASVVEEALVPIDTLQDGVREARRMRDAVGQAWESALAALRRGTRAAADEGAPELHATLFPPVTRVSKSKAAEQPAASGTQTPAAPSNAA